MEVFSDALSKFASVDCFVSILEILWQYRDNSVSS